MYLIVALTLSLLALALLAAPLQKKYFLVPYLFFFIGPILTYFGVIGVLTGFNGSELVGGYTFGITFYTVYIAYQISKHKELLKKHPLKFIFSVIKINNNLENIGDNLNAIAEIILKLSEPFPKEVLEKVKLFEMMELAFNQYSDVINAFIRKENETARELIPNDNEIDEIKHSSVRVLIQMIKDNPQETETYLHLISILNRVEKIGDYAENIAKEIVFSVEGKIYKREIDSDNSFEESEG
jgi:phosphate uptake regulator